MDLKYYFKTSIGTKPINGRVVSIIVTHLNKRLLPGLCRKFLIQKCQFAVAYCHEFTTSHLVICG
jgi:hypothetical protein